MPPGKYRYVFILFLYTHSPGRCHGLYSNIAQLTETLSHPSDFPGAIQIDTVTPPLQS
jgi:hypothetical protein